MNLFESALSVLLLGVVISGFVTMRTHFADVGDAERMAAVVVDAHAGAQAYLEHQYPIIEQCLAGDVFARHWRAQRRADAEVYNTGQWIPVPLYLEVEGSPPRNTDPAFLGVPFPLGMPDGYPDANPDCLPSLARAGFLPASLMGLRYGQANEHLLHDRYDFRLMVRLIQSDPDPLALEPVMGVQMLLTLRTPPRDPMRQGFVQRLAETTHLPEAGYVASQPRGDVVADQTIEGALGSWRMTLCSLPGVTTGAANNCPDLAGDGLDNTVRVDITEIPIGAGLQSVLARTFAQITDESVSGGRRPTAAGDTPYARLVTVVQHARDAALRDVLYRTPLAGLPERQRMETELDFSGHGLVNVGFIAGIDSDNDGFTDQGPVLLGPARAGEWEDRDGDGTADMPNERLWQPTTVIGDLHVTGALVVSPERFPRTFTSATDEPNNLQPGSLVVSGEPLPATATTPADIDAHDAERGRVHLYGQTVQIVGAPAVYDSDGGTTPDMQGTYVMYMETDEYRQRPVREENGRWRPHMISPLIDTDTLNGGVQISAHGTDASIIRFTSGQRGHILDITHNEDADIGRKTNARNANIADATRATGGDVSMWTEAGGHIVSTTSLHTRSDIVAIAGGGPRMPGEPPAGYFDPRAAGESSIRRITRADDGQIIDRTFGTNGRIQIATTGMGSSIALATNGNDANINMTTRGSRSPIAVETFANSEIDVLTHGDTDEPIRILATEGDIVVETAHADHQINLVAGATIPTRTPRPGIHLETRQENQPIRLATVGDTSPVALQTAGDAASIRALTTGANAFISAHTAGANAPITLHTTGRGTDDRTNAGVHVWTTQANNPIRFETRGADADIAATTLGARADIVQVTEGEEALIHRETKGVNAQIHTRTAGLNADVRTATLGEGANQVWTTSGEDASMTMHATHETSQVFISPLAGLALSDEIELAGVVGAADETITLREALGSAALAPAHTGQTTRNRSADSVEPQEDCPDHTTRQELAIPTAWVRDQFAAERVVTIAGHGSFSLNEPYVGWAADPEDGTDIGDPTGDGSTIYTRMTLCTFEP